jgi:hypothetical protein
MFALSWLGSVAYAENVKFLQINLVDKSISVALSEHPTISYAYNQMHIVTSQQAVDVSVADVISYTFETTETAINSLKLPDTDFRAGQLFFNGLPGNSTIELFSTDGKLLETVKASQQGQATVNMREKPKGVYILRTAKTSFKFTNK